MCVFSFHFCSFINPSLHPDLIPSNLQIGELTRRRKVVFDRFLKPALQRLVEEPKIGKELKNLLRHIFDQSAGPPDTKWKKWNACSS